MTFFLVRTWSSPNQTSKSAPFLSVIAVPRVGLSLDEDVRAFLTFLSLSKWIKSEKVQAFPYRVVGEGQNILLIKVWKHYPSLYSGMGIELKPPLLIQ